MIPPGLNVVQIPFSIFFQPQDFGDKITLSSRLKSAAQGALDGESLVLPTPPGNPPDAPRIQLESQDKSLILVVTQRRMAFEWFHRTREGKSWEACSPRYFQLLESILRVFAGEYSKPVRFALNPQFVCIVNGSVSQYLGSQVIQAGRVGRPPSQVKISLLDQMTMAGRVMNLWMNVSAARAQDNPSKDPGLVVHFDFNSAAEDTRPLSVDDMMTIMSEGVHLMDLRLRTFFADLFPKQNPE